MGGVLSGITGGDSPSSAATKAGKAEYQAAKIAIDEQRRQFDESQERMKPWQEAGKSALGLQSKYAGIDGKDAQSQAFADYMASPNLQMYKNAGMDTLNRNAIALGGIGRQQVVNALGEKGLGWASQDYENQYNRLAGLSNTGQATGQQIGALGQNTSSAIGNLGMQGAKAMSNAAITGQQAETAQNTQAAGAALGFVGGLF